MSRLSPEKEPERFVALVEALERRGALRADDDGIVPLLCASTSGTYADTVRDRFRAVASRVGGTCESNFLDAVALARVYRGAYLNVHPCARDAYGMTMVEAAAFGTPSVSQRGSTVGCSALLREEASERVAANVEDVEAFADVVERALRDVEERATSARGRAPGRWRGTRPRTRSRWRRCFARRSTRIVATSESRRGRCGSGGRRQVGASVASGGDLPSRRRRMDVRAG